MDLQKLCGALRRGSVDAHRCLGCGYEHNCSIHGCQIMKEAANQLEDLHKQVVQAKAMNQSIFRLGQMDMKESVIKMLRDAADVLPADSIVGAALLAAADLVKDMEVTHGAS